MRELSLPFQDPILIFSTVLLIILIAPAVLKRIRVPGIIGLLLAGVGVGPNGLYLLERDASIVLFGTVGLLYIMFLAGLEIDLHDFQKYRSRSLVFGALTFLIPQTIGTLVGTYFLGFGWPSAILLASMFASHTLLAYPIISRLGLARNEAVSVTVGGTIITDTAALLVLSVIAGAARGELSGAFWLWLSISFVLFVFTVLWLFPRVGTWFFKNSGSDSGSQYVFVLAFVFAAAFLAQVAGVEAIIGAFLAGIALNRLIPGQSPLMNRIHFVGNTLFIPFFLISVGMLVDLRVLLRGPEALIVAVTMIVVACIGKWLPAFLTQALFGYSVAERNIIFGLSNAQAAATLAAVLVGFDLGLLNENVLNGTILMILVTCLISFFVVENAGRQLAIADSDKRPDLGQLPEKILVPIANPATLEQLIDLAIMIKNPRATGSIHPLVVIKDDDRASEKVLATHKVLDRAMKHAAATEHALQPASRIALNVASGIIRATKELTITEIVMGWNAQVSASDRIFGSVLDNLLQGTQQMTVVSKLIYPLNVTKRILVLIPAHAELETGFARWVNIVHTLAKQVGARVVFYGTPVTLHRLELMKDKMKSAVDASYHDFKVGEGFVVLASEIEEDDLLVIISARQGTVSHSNYLDATPGKLARYFQENSFLIIYPAQNAFNPNTGTHQLDTF